MKWRNPLPLIMRVYQFFVYIMASESGTLYIGFTNHLERRVYQHKNGVFDGFSKKYGCHKLVYFEEFGHVHDAHAREKQLKRWSRKKKEDLIRLENPTWIDLAMHW